MKGRHFAFVFGVLLLLRSVSGFYLPGVAPQDYVKVKCVLLVSRPLLELAVLECSDCSLQGDKEVLKVNKLTSIKTQLPYEYYSIPYCRPESIKSSAENLGEVLRGDRIENSPYEVLYQTADCCRSSRDRIHAFGC